MFDSHLSKEAYYSPVFHSPYNFMNPHYDPENATFDRDQRSIGL